MATLENWKIHIFRILPSVQMIETTVMASHGEHCDHCCSSQNATPSVCQTLDELDFERGIWYPALAGDIEGVKSSLGKGNDPNATDGSGYTALHYAGRNGHYEICEMLLKKGACVNFQTKSGKATPLHRAAYMGHEGIVKLFLSYKANVSTKDSDGNTAVHKAIDQGHKNVARILVEKCPELARLLQSSGDGIT